MPRPDYNHPRWPSPCARLVAIKLELDYVNGQKIKRLTHQQALELLSKKAKKTVPEFLALTKDAALIAVGSYQDIGFRKIPIHPLYPNRYDWT